MLTRNKEQIKFRQTRITKLLNNKSVARLLIFAMAFLCAITINTSAQTITLNICQDGCAFKSLDDGDITIDNDIDPNNPDSIEMPVDFVINFKDNNDYEFHWSIADSIQISSLTINGNNNRLYGEYDEGIMANNINVNNVQFDNYRGFYFSGNVGYEEFMQYYDNPEENVFLDNKINLNNVTLNSSDGIVQFIAAEVNINNCKLLTSVNAGLAEVHISNSTIEKTLLAGGAFPTGNIHILPNNTVVDIPKRISIKSEDMYADYEDSLLSDMYYATSEKFSDAELDATGKLSNHIYVYQEIDKTIKSNTNLSMFESEFTNTYIDSIGYDDIKDLPIEWKSENESIVMLDNGVIVPVSADKVDLIGKRGDDIYTIHLTVEKETIPEKIDKMTIKVPITGKKIKVWVIVVSLILLGIVSGCAYMLIKRKK